MLYIKPLYQFTNISLIYQRAKIESESIKQREEVEKKIQTKRKTGKQRQKYKNSLERKSVRRKS